MERFLPYDPGVIPSRPSPEIGARVEFVVDGVPPTKTVRQSIRNQGHPQHHRFVALRAAAISAMAGRAWTFGPVALEVVVRSPNVEERASLVDFLAGIMDTLGGSSGATFTFLPIIFEDDSQVAETRIVWESADRSGYTIAARFGDGRTS